MAKKKESEFGKGLAYCLGLFIAHEERGRYDKQEDGAELWFYGASDHCCELVIPAKLPKALRNRLKDWRDKCLGWRFSFDNTPKATKADREWAIAEAKELLRELDEVNGIRTIEASWK